MHKMSNNYEKMIIAEILLPFFEKNLHDFFFFLKAHKVYEPTTMDK